ncbi:MAG: DUF4416 family protein [Planctomycetes bacterium]|nr:DUF4416 family protein [Planctomycetota bacterium]
MGQPTPHPPALLLMAAISRHAAALRWARDRAIGQWGPIALESRPFEFIETDYYESTMGSDLRKQFFTFTDPFDPSDLADVKLLTNRWEEEYAAVGDYAEARPLNLDPGYLTMAKLVLASTKDHAHRIYLGQGIYAEITIFYRGKRWQHHDLTYADYRREDFQAFFSECRQAIHRRQREGHTT